MDPIHRIVELDPRKKAFSLLEEFKSFAFKGNVIDLAVGVIIGAAFGKIVDSLVKKVMMFPLNRNDSASWCVFRSWLCRGS